MNMFIFSCIQATILFFTSIVVVDDSVTPYHGIASDMWLDGSISYAAVLVAITAKIMYDQNSHTCLSFTFITLSVGAYFLSLFLMSTISWTTLGGDFNHMFMMPCFFICIFFSMFY